MKVKMLKLAAGPQVVLQPGETYTVSEAVGQALVDIGAAVRVGAQTPPARDLPPKEKVIETADIQPMETAVIKPAAKRRAKRKT